MYEKKYPYREQEQQGAFKEKKTAKEVKEHRSSVENPITG